MVLLLESIFNKLFFPGIFIKPIGKMYFASQAAYTGFAINDSIFKRLLGMSIYIIKQFIKFKYSI